MATVGEVSGWIAEQLPDLITRYDVPAASVAVLADGQVVDHAAGILSMSTGVEATTDSVFQVGSVTKLWTSSLVLQLVDEGRVDLDAAVRGYLPEFRIADEDAARAITVRQLLTHTSGFEGDLFTDTGQGDDCIERFLGVLRDVPQLFPPGRMWSYNNAGFCVLGRLVEVLREQPFDAVLRTHLILPLGITNAAPGPYDAILFRAAVGHYEDSPGAGLHPTPVWALARSNIAAGAMLAMSARSLIGFARMQLDDGRAPGGTQVLAPGTPARMQAREVDLPYLGHLGTSWGLGFERFDTPAGPILGHDGNTIGQSAFLRLVPGTGVAIAVLTNGGKAGPLFHDLADHVLSELTGRRLPQEPLPPEDPPEVDATRFVGTYTCREVTMMVSQAPDGSVWLDAVPTGELSEQLGEQPERHELVRFGDDTLITRERDGGLHRLYAFVGDDGHGHAGFLHSGRALVRAPA